MANTPYPTKAEVQAQRKTDLLNQRLIFQDSFHARPKTPIVSFISDDGHIENDDWYIPILDAKGVKSSFAIITGRYDLSGFYNKQQVKDLAAAGHDIISHTHTHENLTTLTPEAAEDSLLRAKLSLASLGEETELFVPPFGGTNVDVDKQIRQFYKASFKAVVDDEITAGTCCNTPPIDSYFIKRVNFDANGNTLRLQIMKDAVDVAVSTGGWLVFVSHAAFAEYQPEATNYLARRDELNQLIDYIQSLNIPILTATQAFNYYKNPIEIGNTRLDEKYYAMGMDGTETGNYFDEI